MLRVSDPMKTRN